MKHKNGSSKKPGNKKTQAPGHMGNISRCKTRAKPSKRGQTDKDREDMDLNTQGPRAVKGNRSQVQARQSGDTSTAAQDNLFRV